MLGSSTIITSTYNKEEFFKDGIETVLNQTRTNWRWWIILDGANFATMDLCLNLAHRDSRVTLFKEDVSYNQRHDIYRPSMLMNKYFPLITTDYFCWLSDDDLLELNFLETLAGMLDMNSDWDVVYGGCQVIEQTGKNQWNPTYRFPIDFKTVYNSHNMPCGHIDGGSILQTKKSYDFIKPWQFPTLENHRISDGLYMNELAKHFTFYPAKVKLLTHRQTKLSENTRSGFRT
jgi:glycosyltransferase involved in cell wall biosynthesis